MTHRNAILAVVVIVLFLSAGIFAVIHLNRPRVIARAVSPGGVEMCIIQRCNWGPELFTTGFYYRKPGTTWGWFYYDHQDSYWGRGTVSLDVTNTTAVFFRDSAPAVTFDWTAERYTLHRINRTLTGAQNWAPAGASDPY